MSRKRISLQAFFLSVILPVAVGVALLLGWFLRQYVSAGVMAGVDQELEGISALTASFIDGDRHQALIPERSITVLSYDPDGGYLLGVDVKQKEIVRIDRYTGVARGLVAHPDADKTMGLLRDGPGNWLLLDADGLERYHLRISSSISAWLSEIHFDNEAFDPPLPPGQVALRSGTQDSGILSWDEEQQLWIWQLPGANGEQRTFAPVYDGDYQLGTAPALAWDGERVWIADAQLAVLDIESATVSTEPYVIRYFQEDDSFYLRHVRALQTIVARTGLTYLYSFVYDPVSGEDHIFYVLDGTFGDDLSPIGSPDVLPSEKSDIIETIFVRGLVLSTPIEEWENWGLIKSGFAPVWNRERRIVAATGSDLNVDAIQRLSRAALIAAFLAGVGLLSWAIRSSIVTAGRVAQPLLSLRDYALALAAGNLAKAPPPLPIREFNQLGETLNKTRKRLLQQTSTYLKQVQHAREDMARDRINDVLKLCWPTPEQSHRLAFHVDESEESLPPAEFGWKCLEQHVVFWRHRSERMGSGQRPIRDLVCLIQRIYRPSVPVEENWKRMQEWLNPLGVDLFVWDPLSFKLWGSTLPDVVRSTDEPGHTRLRIRDDGIIEMAGRGPLHLCWMDDEVSEEACRNG